MADETTNAAPDTTAEDAATATAVADGPELHPALFPNHGKPERAGKVPRTVAVIDQNGCTGCEVCIDFCPVDCIELAYNPEMPGLFNVVEVDQERCISCQLCAKHCPWETIYMVKTDESQQFAAENTVRSVMYKWGKEKYPGQDEYFEQQTAESA